ncbi:protein-export chaperone SecB [Halorhodospira abdelmalekii]|uniref:protein-export chaperone SecB n=1 Tax=Halorhodospira abdelmalekii TaxID=421629 RepID=UPI0019086F6C|nr:protein-export chaperone SecB [Halorhodospira abdelmalekii]MBK1733710.1 protein-export chaperone SecB [Halorhodospira abdelmalekii]
MADEHGNGSAAAGAQGEAKQSFQIAKVYLSDVSFEAPGVPEAFRGEWRPQIDVELGSRIRELEANTYDVILIVTVTAKNDDQTAFLCEVKQGGVFRLEGFPSADLDRILGAYCPAQLFPFAREAVNDLVVRGGFPQLLLSPVNFESLYLQQRQQRQQQQNAASGNGEAVGSAQNSNGEGRR